MEKELSFKVIGAAIEIHKRTGPGMLESIYDFLLIDELRKVGISAKYQVPIELVNSLGDRRRAFYIDLLVSNQLIVELKVVKEITDAHISQLNTYMRMSKCREGLILNFGTPRLKDGIKRLLLQ